MLSDVAVQLHRILETLLEIIFVHFSTPNAIPLIFFFMGKVINLNVSSGLAMDFVLSLYRRLPLTSGATTIKSLFAVFCGFLGNFFVFLGICWGTWGHLGGSWGHPGPEDAPKRPPRQPKRPSRRPKVSPRGLQNGPRWPQDDPKRLPRRPKMAQDGPGWLPKAPKGSKKFSRRPQERLGDPQEVPKGHPK